MEVIVIEPGGWIRVLDADPEFRLRFRIAPDGRIEPTGIEILDPEHVLSNRLLQEIPFGLIEAMANWPGTAEYLRESIEEPDDFDDLAINLAERLRRPSEVKELMDHVKAVLKEKPSRYPEEFYRDIAYLYALHAAGSGKPAQLLADRLGVPVSTVWRWIRVCRERQLLPPARAGKEG